MYTDYIPGTIAEYRRFSDHFVEVVSQKATVWGIPAAAVERLTTGHTAWTTVQDEADNRETRTPLVVEKASRLRGEDKANIRWMVNTYIKPNALGTITPEDMRDLGVHIRDTTITHHPAPTSRPETTVSPSGRFQHTVTAINPATNKRDKPADVHGICYAWQLGGEPPVKSEDLPKSRFSQKTREIFAWDSSDQGKTVY
ncbi:MAG: hypothetical protein LBO67_06310, partial [Spirochaetaceae bacterium]|nr:hypothetical protein [Spirochaetaceae bacterium]